MNCLKKLRRATPSDIGSLAPRGKVATYLTLVLAAVAIFVSARGILGPIAAPGGTIFALEVLILLAFLGGKLVTLLSNVIAYFFKVDLKMPPLLGMLVVGILLKNIPYNIGQFGRADCVVSNLTDHSNHTIFVDSIHDQQSEQHKPLEFKRSIQDDLELNRHPSFHPLHLQSLANSSVPLDCVSVPRYIGHDLDPAISRTLRTICLTVILLMAGLELDPVKLWNLSGMVMRATFIPCFVEAFAVAVLSHFALGFPWTVGFMLGFVLAAVSPAVIIPCLMSLSNKGYGVSKGIPTLVIAACSADDVVAISGFGIFMGFTFNKDSHVLDLIFHGPIEIAIGITFGLVWGLLVQFIPNENHHNTVFFRWLIILGGGLIALFGAHIIEYDGAGGLAAITMAFVATIKWRKEPVPGHTPVMKIFEKMWLVLEPVIFALIGTEIQIHKINPETLGYGIIVLVVSLAFRMVGTYFAVSGGNLNVKEKIFMSFAWMPKATVQAALGPLALSKAKNMGDTDFYPIGEQILTMAVLSILLTAPLGAVAIMGLGPKLLSMDLENDDKKEPIIDNNTTSNSNVDHDNVTFQDDML